MKFKWIFFVYTPIFGRSWQNMQRENREIQKSQSVNLATNFKEDWLTALMTRSFFFFLLVFFGKRCNAKFKTTYLIYRCGIGIKQT